MSEQQFGYPEQSAPHPGGESSEALGELLTRYWALFKRYYWILILTGIAGVGVAYLWTDRQPNIYQATSKLLFHESQPNVFGSQFEEVEFVDPGGRFQFEQFWNTQREVLNSTGFAERVVQQTRLAEHERFAGGGENGEDHSDTDPHEQAVSTVQSATNYSLKDDSRVAVVEVQIDDPQLAATIANGIAEEYVEYIREYQSGGVEQLSEWFDNYVSNQRQELDEAHTELQQYQQEHNILSLSYEDRREMTGEALDSVSARLRDVEAQLYEEEALLNQITEMEQNDSDLRAIADLMENETLRGAIQREHELEQQRAQLKSRYLDDHPEVRQVDQQLEVVRETIDEEIARNRTSIENQVSITRRNAEQLEAERQRLTDEIAELNDIGLEYTQLRDSTETMRQHYEAVLERTTELDLNALYERNLVEELEPADTPSSPVSPNVPLNLAVGLLAGLLFGAGTMIFIDALDNTIKSPDHIARFTDEPLLGTLPAVKKSALKGVPTYGDSPLDTLAVGAPRSSFSEGVKTLRTNLMFMAPDKPPEVLLLTSPGPGEGKTLTSINMAIALAQSGEKTVLVDSDMRRPRIHKALGVDNQAGITQVLTEGMALDEAIEPAPFDEQLDVVSCGPVPSNPSELLHTEQFRDVVSDLRDRYDRVVFDSPPLAAVADALILSHSADGVLLILRFGQTRQELLGRSIEQLEAIGAPLMGTVLNDVDDSSGYGYAYYYRYRYEESRDARDEDANRLAAG